MFECTGQTLAARGKVKYASFRNRLLARAESVYDISAVATLPNQPNEPVANTQYIIGSFPNLRLLGYSLPTVSEDATISLNVDKCNLDQSINRIDPTK